MLKLRLVFIIGAMNKDGSNNVSSGKPSLNWRQNKIVIIIVALFLAVALLAVAWFVYGSIRPMADNESNSQFLQNQSKTYNDHNEFVSGVLTEFSEETATIKAKDDTTVELEINQDTEFQTGSNAQLSSREKIEIGSNVTVNYWKNTKLINYIWQYEE